MKKTLALLVGIAAMGAFSTNAMGHGATRPQHGGVVQMNGETQFELAAAPAGVSVYVLEEGDPVQASAMTAKLSITAGGKKTEVPMTSLKGNQFFAKGVKLPKGANVGVQVIDNASKARYGTTFIIK